ncbi:MAG: hypothetical protein CTY33_02840 [Methylotenera sp.]|nr:MAG: hypothetical protein CTY33_02840 [Methylotenera sp.]
MFKFVFTFIFFIVAVEKTNAEVMMQANFIGQPVMLMTDGRPNSCGIRIIGYQTPSSNNNPEEELWVPDGSFMIQRSGYGLVKALGYKIKLKDMLNNGEAIGKPIKSFWFKAEGEKATVPVLPIQPGENPLSLLYATDGESITALIDAVFSQKVIQFALKFDSGTDIAFYGKVSLTNDEITQSLACMKELYSLMESDVKKDQR